MRFPSNSFSLATSHARRRLGKGGSIILSGIFNAKQVTLTIDRLARQSAIAVIKWLRKIPTAGANFGRFLWWLLLAGIISKRVRLFVASILFLGWLSYLGYAALTKSRSPIVSHAQAAAAEVAVVAEVEADVVGKPSMKVKVVQTLTPGEPPPGTEIYVMNIAEVQGFEGTGQYLLLLLPNNFLRPNNGEVLPPYVVVGQLRSPGNDLSGWKPEIYRWNEDVRKQYEKLHQ